MKYCAKCGAELMDEAIFCMRCGCAASLGMQFQYQQIALPQKSGASTAAKVFMIIGTVLLSLLTYCIALAWCLPLTIIYFKKVNRGEPIGTGFKICSLLFVSMVAGILMLCDNSN